MTRSIRSLTLLVPALLLISCSNGAKDASAPVVPYDEVAPFLTDKAFREGSGLDLADRNVSFWRRKLEEDPGSDTCRGRLAGALETRFRITGEIGDLNRADSLYGVLLESSPRPSADLYLAAASNSITRHEFRSAYRLARKALETGDRTGASHLLLFDALIERGERRVAGEHLEKASGAYSAGYLIRKSRHEDAMGRLDSAIRYMERVLEQAGHAPGLKGWVLGNLGDMYGHANRIETSYRTYLRALESKSSGGAYLHSLQGIAWIAYAHDYNPGLARRILRFIDGKSGSPSIKLKLAELAEYQGREEERGRLTNDFLEEAGKTSYGAMYGTALIRLALEGNAPGVQVERLVAGELSNRPSPEIYTLKAWLEFEKGRPESALQLLEEYVAGQTEEPAVAYRMAQLYAAAGMPERGRSYARLAIGSRYELGPVAIDLLPERLVTAD